MAIKLDSNDSLDYIVNSIKEKSNNIISSAEINIRRVLSNSFNDVGYYYSNKKYISQIDDKINLGIVDLVYYDNSINNILCDNNNYISGHYWNKQVNINKNFIPKFIKVVVNSVDAWHKSLSYKIKMGSIIDHNYTFSHIIKGVYKIGETNIDMQGSMTPGFNIPLYDDNATLIYIKIDDVHTFKISKAASFVVATNYNKIIRNNYNIPVCLSGLYGNYNNINYINNTNNINIIPIIKNYNYDNLMEIINNTKIPDFSSIHHENVKIEDFSIIFKDLNNIKLINMLDLESLSDLGRPALLGIILWWLLVKDYERIIIYSHGLFTKYTHVDFIKTAKFISDISKYYQNVCGLNLKNLFEIQTLINRIETKLDWHKEKENRIKPNLANIPTDFILNKSIEMFNNKLINHSNHYRTQSWSDFWMNRFEWCTSGAVFSQYNEDSSYVDSRQMYKNKMLQVNAMESDINFEKFINRKPELCAKTSVKYEWSKQRAIYGCDLTSFILFQFCMNDCENGFDDRFPSGRNSSPDKINALMKSVLNKRDPLCLDYEDFNSQHSIPNMKAVLIAYRHVYKSRMSEDQLKAMEWCINSLDECWVVDNVGTNSKYKINGTLFSGWRLTSFMNTALNYCYFEYINNSIRFDQHLHSGDDTIVGIDRFHYYRDLIYNAYVNNIRLSIGKCHYGSVGEFLRVDHFSKETGQYLCRSIATLVFSRIESMPAYDIIDCYSNHLMRVSAIYSRGGCLNICKNLLYRILMRENQHMSGKRVPPDIVLQQSRVCGGLSDLKVCKYFFDIVKEPFWKLKELGIVDNSDLPEKYLYGIDDYIHILKKKFYGYSFSKKNLKDKINDSLIQTYAIIKSRYKFVELNQKQIYQRKVWRAIKGAHTQIRKYIDYGRARTIGILINVLSNTAVSKQLVKVVNVCDDPLRVLSLII